MHENFSAKTFNHHHLACIVGICPSTYSPMRRALPLTLLCLALVACQDKSTQPQADAQPATATAAAQPQADGLPLKDVLERNPRYLVGITYPASANQYPKLAATLHAYSQSARDDLAEAVKQAEEDQLEGAFYDLSLNFSELQNRADALVVAANGTLYTGGAHGMPLEARFVYLPKQDTLLEADKLIADQAGWQAISSHVRAALRQQLTERLQAEGLPEEEQREIIKSTSGMINEGTEPEPDNFAQFEPIPAADGKWLGLKFVFPPYQVAPYADGTHIVEVPARVLRAHVAPDYQALFSGG